MPFEDWVRKVFDHPFDRKNPWYFQIDAEIELVPPATFVDYGARLFCEAELLLGKYSDAQIEQGLSALIDNNISDNIFAVRDETIPLESRANFLRSIYELNRQCFEQRCTPHLSHLDYKNTPENVSRLNMICYMWWDVSSIYGETKDSTSHPLNEACLWVMENALKLSNPAVLEGALHG